MNVSDKRHWKQGVKLLKKPVEIKEGEFSEMEAFFDPCNGEVVLEHSFQIAAARNI